MQPKTIQIKVDRLRGKPCRSGGVKSADGQPVACVTVPVCLQVFGLRRTTRGFVLAVGFEFQLIDGAGIEIQIHALAAIHGLVDAAALVGVQITHLNDIAR